MQLRPRFGADDIEGLVPSVAGVKTAAPRERAEQPATHPDALALVASILPNDRLDPDPGIERVPIAAPTRERARLMVFLN